MADEIQSPLLELVKDQGMLDDLQYEEVVSEHKRTGAPISQIIQDFGFLDADTIVQVMSNHLGAEVVELKNRDLPPELISEIPSNTARMYQCVPVEMSNGVLRVAFADPLDPANVDELNFVVKKEVQLVVADPEEVRKAVEKYYGEEAADYSEILKQIGADQDIAKEVE